MKGCPTCKSTSKVRVKRKTITKLIPGTKRYACDNCNREYTYFSILNTTL